MSRTQIKTIWGLAKTGLNLSDDDLYAIVARETDKDSIKACTTKELNRVIQVLIHLKELYEARPDKGTKKMLWKIRQLEKELGWDDSPMRLTAFLKKYYSVEKPEWLSRQEAWKAIESLKKVIERKKDNGGREEVQSNS